MIESLEQNNLLAKLRFNFKNKVNYQIIVFMIAYWLILNFMLLIVSIVTRHWLIISGFNLGFVGSLIGFFLLILTSKWLTSATAIKQVLAYLSFIFRMMIYAVILLLVIFFNIANIVSLIAGFSMLMIATITSQLFKFKK